MITDDEYLKLLQNYDFNYKSGDIVKGVIEGYDKNNLIVDIKAKSSAICPEKEILKEENENVKDLYKLKEEYDFFIMYKDEDEDIYYLSAKKVAVSINSKILKIKSNKLVIVELTPNKLSKLQKDLQKAIKDERYEDAAKIRDEIKKLEDEKTKNKKDNKKDE